MRPTIALGLALLPSTGCYSVHSVEKWTDTEPNGVPFYAARGVWKQTTTYTLTWLEVSIAPVGEQENPSAVFLMKERDWNREKAMQALEADDPVAAFSEAFAASLFSSAELGQELSGESPVSHLRRSLIGNTVEPLAVADYGQRYAYNVQAPFIGTASSMFELGADGTLRKAEAKVDSTKLADVLPISDLLTTALGLGVMEMSDDYQLSMREKGYVYTFTQRLEWESPPKAPLAFDTNTIPFTRVPLEAGAKPKPKPGKSIEFGGTILMPEEMK